MSKSVSSLSTSPLPSTMASGFLNIFFSYNIPPQTVTYLYRNRCNSYRDVETRKIRRNSLLFKAMEAKLRQYSDCTPYLRII